MTPNEMREAAAARPVGDPPEVGSVRDLDIDGIPATLYHPLGLPDHPPLVAFFHGGGWVLPFTPGHDVTARHLANKSGCAFLAVDYRLAPEHRFPAAYKDSWRATRWASEHLAELGCKPGAIGVTGDSAGGNLAAAVALRARTSTVDVGVMALVYPALDVHPDHHRSFDDFADAPILDGKLARWFLEQYRGDSDPDDWRIAPFSAADLSGLPPTVIVAAEVDPLLTEGEKWAKRLSRSGVPTQHHVIPGTFHAFFGFVDDLEEAREAQWLVADALRRSLG